MANPKFMRRSVHRLKMLTLTEVMPASWRVVIYSLAVPLAVVLLAAFLRITADLEDIERRAQAAQEDVRLTEQVTVPTASTVEPIEDMWARLNQMLPSEIADYYFDLTDKRLDKQRALCKHDLATKMQIVIGPSEFRDISHLPQIRDKLKMTHVEVFEWMESEFGKFDWRLPGPHAIYWARVAAEADPEPKSKSRYDRIILLSLEETVRRGELGYVDPDPDALLLTAFDLSKIEPVNKLYWKMIAKYPDGFTDTHDVSIRDRHIQSLQESTFDLYFAGYPKRAMQMHQVMHEVYGKPDPYMPMEPYVLGQVKKMVVEESGFMSMRGGLVDPLVYYTCFFMCTNHTDMARRCESYARYAWKAYREYDEAQPEGRIQPWLMPPTFKSVEGEIVAVILLLTIAQYGDRPRE